MDEKFAARLKRIETGTTWVPDGVVVERDARKAARKRSAGARKQKVVAFTVTPVLLFVLFTIVTQGEDPVSARLLPQEWVQKVADATSSVPVLSIMSGI